MDIGVLGIFAVLYLALWYFFLRPQQQRAKKQRAMLTELTIGDEVLTSAGMYGQITEFDGSTVFLAVADNLEIKVTRESIAERVVYGDPEPDVADDVEDES